MGNYHIHTDDLENKKIAKNTVHVPNWHEHINCKQMNLSWRVWCQQVTDECSSSGNTFSLTPQPQPSLFAQLLDHGPPT